MKSFIFLLLAITLCSCERNEIEINNSIIGEWKLIRSEIYGINSSGQSEFITSDYTSKNVIYNFQKNKMLKVSGDENLENGKGEFSYEFKKDYLSGFPSGEESKINFVIINDTRWVFNSSKSQMTLDNSYIDGPKLTFVKK